ncbi:MAG: hypothetical protein H6619_06170 [Deltaproteobacteria bacterium]|nr:hypothetical protein [Deltaproteobacteria bacterium]
MIFSRKKHKLPKFPDYIAPAFRNMCSPLSEEDIDKLRVQLYNYMGEVEEEYRSEGMVDLDLAREIAQRCSLLLDEYPNLPEMKKPLAAGGVKYFLSDGDGICDFSFASGLLDDAQVINHVLEELALDDKFIQVSKYS